MSVPIFINTNVLRNENNISCIRLRSCIQPSLIPLSGGNVSFLKILFDFNFFHPEHDNKKTQMLFLFQNITASDLICKRKLNQQKLIYLIQINLTLSYS